MPLACLTLGTKLRFGAHAHGEADITAPYRPCGVSNTKATGPLSLWRLVPTPEERPITTAPYRPQGV